MSDEQSLNIEDILIFIQAISALGATYISIEVRLFNVANAEQPSNIDWVLVISAVLFSHSVSVASEVHPLNMEDVWVTLEAL